jgi:integrase
METQRALAKKSAGAARVASGAVVLPEALARKYPSAPREWIWQWVFPATRTYTDPATGDVRRHHLHETVIQRAVHKAAIAAGITKPITPHTMRHSFATTCWKTATASAPSKSYSATAT